MRIASVAFAMVLLMGFTNIAQAQEQLGNSKLANNCVLYARSIVPELPLGLFTLWDKLKIVNTDYPVPGAIIIVKTRGKSGHLAYAREIKDGKINTEEANWKKGKVINRWIDINDPSIKGYYLSPTLLAQKIEKENRQKMIVLLEQVQSLGRYANRQL